MAKVPGIERIYRIQKHTVGGHKLDRLVKNSTTAVAAKVRVNPALPATPVAEFVSAYGIVLYNRVTKNLAKPPAKVTKNSLSQKIYSNSKLVFQ